MPTIVDLIPSMTDQELLNVFENATQKLSENKNVAAAESALSAWVTVSARRTARQKLPAVEFSNTSSKGTCLSSVHPATRTNGVYQIQQSDIQS
jgi:hypothetical protein